MGDIQKSTTPSAAVERVPAGLEERLEWLTRFGKPRVCFDGKGWSAHMEMHVANAGAEFTVRSEFNMDTPSAALDQCITRMLETLAKYNATRSDGNG